MEEDWNPPLKAIQPTTTKHLFYKKEKTPSLTTNLKGL
jgi:hypothetical protein